MRLIDADKLIKYLTAHMDFLVPINTEKLTQSEIKKIIHAQPTAYDVKKVVEKLRESEMCPRCANNCNKISYCATFCDVGKKLDFVRKGGAE